jgi:23S rRNA pseudouridine2605 synthase
VEEKTKKTAAAKTSTKKVAEVSPKEKTIAAKTVKAAATKKPVPATKAAPKAKAASKSKSAEVPIAAAKPAAKKAAASKAKSADAPVAAEKPAAKKAPASKSKSAEATVVAEKPAAKKAAASKAKSAEAPIVAAKPAAKKAAASKANPAEAPIAAEKPASKKATSKSKASKVEAPASESAQAAAEDSAKKVRTKPRRRELKRLGLLQPKENKKQKRYDDAQKAKLEGKDASPKAKGKTTEIKLESKEKPVTSKSNSAAGGKPKARDHKAEERVETKSKAGKGKPKLMPEEFGGFQKQISPKAERKNERRKERQEKAEREMDQSHGLFEEPIRLNRFVALSGICSRRDADGLISDGKVKVNGKVVKEMGHKVQPGKDVVVYKDHELRIKVFVYLLMNKPKNKLTTTEDELGRDTVMEIADRYTKARVYPVGRLDRNTTGLLLLTNDGDLTKKLTHASSKFAKIYHVRLDKEVAESDILALRKGIALEEGVVKAEKVEYLASGGLNELAIQIQSGANHVVKRMVEHLGFEIVTLDRVQYGPLDKRGLPRGTCRLLSEKEIGFLKML